MALGERQDADHAGGDLEAAGVKAPGGGTSNRDLAVGQPAASHAQPPVDGWHPGARPRLRWPIPSEHQRASDVHEHRCRRSAVSQLISEFAVADIVGPGWPTIPGRERHRPAPRESVGQRVALANLEPARGSARKSLRRIGKVRRGVALRSRPRPRDAPAQQRPTSVRRGPVRFSEHGETQSSGYRHGSAGDLRRQVPESNRKFFGLSSSSSSEPVPCAALSLSVAAAAADRHGMTPSGSARFA